VVGTADLRRLPLEPGSVDGVVSISALEHNDVAALGEIVDVLFKAIRPGGALLATVGGARDGDWFHESSHGWCMTEANASQRLPSRLGRSVQLRALERAFREAAELGEAARRIG